MRVQRNITDRGLRYRAQNAIPEHERRCVFCGAPDRKQNGARPFLEVAHLDGNESNEAPDNLSWSCRSCNVLAGNSLRSAGRGRLTHQMNPARRNPSKAGGAATLGEWMQAVGAITPHVDRGSRGLVSDMPVSEAVRIIRATPHFRRSQFAKELRSRSASRASDRWNPATRKNLFGFGKKRAAAKPHRSRSPLTLAQAVKAARKAGYEQKQTFSDWLEAKRLEDRSDEQLRRLGAAYQAGIDDREAEEREAAMAKRAPKQSGTYRGYRIFRDGDEYYSSLDPDSRFETFAAVRKHIDWAAQRSNPSVKQLSKAPLSMAYYTPLAPTMALLDQAGRRNPSKFDRCVKAVKKRGGAYDPYAVCTAAGTRNPVQKSRGHIKFLDGFEWYKAGGEVYRAPVDAAFESGYRIGRWEFPEWQISKRRAAGVYPFGKKNPGAFEKCLESVEARGGARDPRAVCAAAGRKKYGQREMTRRAVAGKRKAARGKRNPAALAAERFEEFHGRPVDEIVTVEKQIHFHSHLAAAGELRKLVVKGIDHQIHTITGFRGAILAFNEQMSQLFIEGGDQAVNLEDFGIKKPHELEELGKVLSIDYFTRKDHLGDEGGTAVYEHEFRTTNENGEHVTVHIARYPRLIYRVIDEQLEFAGGSYTIRREGIDL